eukprot:3892890-Heterocapsa_arctica.AAC.1
MEEEHIIPAIQRAVAMSMMARAAAVSSSSGAACTGVAAVSSSSGNMQIQVERLIGRTITLNVSPHDTVANVKNLIYNRESIPPHQQCLLFRSTPLEDNRSL